jgi:two-component system KDP operon response regulator KdpE
MATGTAASRVLVVDDEDSIRRLLRAALQGHGYETADVSTGSDALAEFALRPTDLVILDLGLPDLPGREVLRRIRTRSNVPVIILTAAGHELDKVAAFDAGADDYLTKPFGIQELLARMRAVWRRAPAGSVAPTQYTVGDLLIDFSARRVFVRKQEVRLTPTEYRLLGLLARNSGKVLTHRQLLGEVWGPEHVSEVNYLRVFMAGLRRKIEVDSAQPRYLLTDQGVGYRLADE